MSLATPALQSIHAVSQMACQTRRSMHQIVKAIAQRLPASANTPTGPRPPRFREGYPTPTRLAYAQWVYWKNHIRRAGSCCVNGTAASRRGYDTCASEGPQARPMMEAVAINSSSNASDTLPETEYGSSSGLSAYFSKMLALILDILTCPIVQPPKRRSEISS